jgi:hypothetical protein
MSAASFALSVFVFVFFAVPDATLGFGAALVVATFGALVAALALGTAADAF